MYWKVVAARVGASVYTVKLYAYKYTCVCVCVSMLIYIHMICEFSFQHFKADIIFERSQVISHHDDVK